MQERIRARSSKAVSNTVSTSRKLLKLKYLLVGAEGFEPPTLWSQTRCATRLRYAPTGFSLSHEVSNGPQNVRNRLWEPEPDNEWKRPSKSHANKSIGKRISAASKRQRPPRKNQLCSVCFRGSSTLPISRA
jgi:hypothetical protein